MAQEWMQVDLDLPEKPQFQRIVSLSGEPGEVVLWRLFHFWRWVERHTLDGVFAGTDLETLARLFGGSPDFWRTLADEHVDWLWISDDRVEIPRYEKRFDKSAKRRAKEAKDKAKKRAAQAAAKPVGKVSTDRRQKPDQEKNQRSESEKNKNLTDQTDQSAPAVPPDPPPATPPARPRGTDADRTDHKDFSREERRKPTRRASKTAKEDPSQRRMFTEVELSRVNEVADELLRQSGYVGADGAIFFEAAAVLEVNPGPLTRHALVDAARGCRLAGRNPPGYFRASVRNLCPDFEERLANLGVWITPRPKSPRGVAVGSGPESPKAKLKRPIHEPTVTDATEEIRRKVLAQLERV